MRRRTVLLSLSAGGLLAACGEAIDRAAIDGAAPVDLGVLGDDLAALKTAFNAARGDVRLLFLAGPSCGACLRALIELNDALGADLLGNERLAVFNVYVPTLGAAEHHARRAAQLMRGKSVSHYWDPGGKSGDAVQEALQIDQYAWDVWLIYGPDATWENEAPPAPATWMHQLHGLPNERRLDAEALAADVRKRLGQLT